MTSERPVDNAPYLTLTHGGLTIEGWSRAAVQSYWRIPELKLGFDLGAQPWDFMGTPNWFVSHTHLDHIAALPVYVARRRMMKMEPPTIYLPKESVADVRELMRVMHRLDRGRQQPRLVGLSAGDEIELSREHVVSAFDTHTAREEANLQIRDWTGVLGAELPSAVLQKIHRLEETARTYRALKAEISRELKNIDVATEAEEPRHSVKVFNTVHTIPSRGFVVWERRNKLREEFVGLPGERIKELRLSGTPVTREVRFPLVAYTGDTSPAGLDNCPACYEAKVLITELSFIRASHRRDKIHKFGHMHLDDFVERAGRFKNELIVVSHFSTRYHPDEVRKLLENRLPPEIKSRMRLWI